MAATIHTDRSSITEKAKPLSGKVQGPALLSWALVTEHDLFIFLSKNSVVDPCWTPTLLFHFHTIKIRQLICAKGEAAAMETETHIHAVHTQGEHSASQNTVSKQGFKD